MNKKVCIHGINLGIACNECSPPFVLPTKISAIWHSKEYDIPVEIVQYLGVRDGERWALVESHGSRTGVPLSELKEIKIESG